MVRLSVRNYLEKLPKVGTPGASSTATRFCCMVCKRRRGLHPLFLCFCSFWGEDISFDQPIDLPFGKTEANGGPVFISIFISQPFNDIVFFLFIHCKKHLSDNPSIRRRPVYHTLGHFRLCILRHYHKWRIILLFLY